MSTVGFKALSVALGVSLFAIGGGAAVAQIDVHAIVKERKENMKAMGDVGTRLRRNLQSDMPDLVQAKADAVDIDTRLQKIVDHFPKGTGPSSGADTHAIEEMFSQLGAFRYRAGKTQDASADFLKSFDTGDITKIREAENAMRGGCGSCHEMFRP